MKKTYMGIILLATVINNLSAQESKNDSLSHKKDIEELVITGQYMPQSIDKSIYKVQVIDKVQIKNMAATSVADVLNQSLNMLVTQDRTSGNSTANIMGLNANYVKVLIDNIPVIGDTGLGSNIDLTKISLNNIERIEVVQGSMGVEYGNGAVAGVINIITSKSNPRKKISGKISLQEETVNKNYNWLKKGQGRHIQNFSLNYNPNANWQTSIYFNHNDFKGYEGDQMGYKYFGRDGKRGYDFQPKQQWDANALIRYNKNNTSLFYKLTYLNESLDYYNPVVNADNVNGQRTYVSRDRNYNTDRWIHQFNIQTKLGSSIRYMGDFSYQTQDRKYNELNYDIPNRKIINEEPERSYYNTKVFYSRGSFSNFLDNKKFDFMLGYELDHTNGYAAWIAGDFGNKPVNQKIFTYANYVSAEWNVTDNFSLRPGARLTVSDKFKNQYNYSLSTRIKTSENSNLRGVFGTANRFPTYEELYTYFVDTNHDIQGNPNLNPEKGYSAGVFFDQNWRTSEDWKLSYNVNALYLNINDRIENVLFKAPATYRYLNVDKYKGLLLSAGFDVKKDQFSFSTLFSLNGISRELKDQGVSSPTDFRYNFQANAAANYTLQNWGTIFSLYYKYSGQNTQYVSDGNLDNPQYFLGKIGSFNLMDFLISQPFFKKQFELSLGVKNIFDVKQITNTTSASSAHNAAETTQNLFYGRSYLARLSYTF